MLAMVANDDAGSLNASGVRTSIASMLAPTGNCVSHPGFIRRRRPGCLSCLLLLQCVVSVSHGCAQTHPPDPRGQ
jgi:hypothetical protein